MKTLGGYGDNLKIISIDGRSLNFAVGDGLAVRLNSVINKWKSAKEVTFSSLRITQCNKFEKMLIRKAIELGYPLKHLYLSSEVAEQFVRWISSNFTKEQVKKLIHNECTTIVLDNFSQNTAELVRRTLEPSAVILEMSPTLENCQDASFDRKVSEVFRIAYSRPFIGFDLLDRLIQLIGRGDKEKIMTSKEEIMREFGRIIPEISMLFE